VSDPIATISHGDSAHFRPAASDKSHFRGTRAQSLEQRCAMIVTTAFARNEIDGCVCHLRGRDSLRYLDRQLEGGGGVRTGDFRFAAGERTIDEGGELLP